MKNKITFCIICLILLSITVKAQIGNEIKSYVDSSEVLINNGRKLLLKKLLEGDIKKSKEIYQFLSSKTANKNYAAFNYTENLYINCLLSDWKEWVNKTMGYRQFYRDFCYQNCYEIEDRLYSEIVKKIDLIKSSVETSTLLNEEEKTALRIYLHLMEKGTADEEYNEMLKSFNKKFRTSKFNDFFNNYMPRVKVKSSFSWVFGSSGTFPTGKLSDNFSANATFLMGMDFNVGQIFTSFYINAGTLNLKIPFYAITETDSLNFDKDEGFSYFEGGLKAGYFLVRNNKFHFAPYVTIAGSNLKSTKFEVEEDEREIKIYNSFVTGPGIHAEFKLFDFEQKNIYNYAYPTYKSFLSLKIDGGYNFITKFEHKEFEGNTAYLRMALVWGIGSF
ncbi:MAG: hypothetical protein DRJ01_07530 [Bacteroidetes bacterium]|nr:MAG: hypothetical protein DRJ01_07530 [Bacteroidota bacterium]